MYDSDGKPVWYYVDGTLPDIGGAVSTQLTDKGVLIGPSWNAGADHRRVVPIEVDFAGNTVWQCPSLPLRQQELHAPCLQAVERQLHAHRVHHDGQPPGSHLPRGERRAIRSSGASTTRSSSRRRPGRPATGATPTRSPSTSSRTSSTPTAAGPGCSRPPTTRPPSEQWLLTGMAKGASVPTQPASDITFSPTSSAFSDTHDPEIHDDGTICFFDNGGYSGGAGGSTTMLRSRAVEYRSTRPPRRPR